MEVMRVTSSASADRQDVHRDAHRQDVPGTTASPVGPGLATIRLDGAPVPAVLADGFVLPLAAAARRAGAGGGAPASVREALADWDRWSSVVRQVADQVAAVVVRVEIVQAVRERDNNLK